MNRLALVVALAMAPATEALAAPDACGNATPPPCASLSNPIYLQVGDTQTNLMKALGRVLRDNTGKPITLVVMTNGSCTNIDLMYHKTGAMSGTGPTYAPSVAENATWDFTQTPCSCTLPAGQAPDIANSAVFNNACTTEAPPATVRVINGPVQAYVTVVPKAQTTVTAITAEEAYYIFGFGMAGMIAPWTDETQLFVRTATKSTQLTWADNIGIPADRFKGIPNDKSAQVVAGVENSTSPDIAIGILGDEVYDTARDKLNVLAFRAFGQYAAYYPDSTFTSHDKKNLRDGHYTVWSPTTWMDNQDANGNPTKADARYVTDLIAGKSVTPDPDFVMTDIVASVGVVPDCAMGVQRSFDGGPLSLYSPAESCVCRYESVVDTTSCSACDGSTPCASGTCRNGFCEVQ
jgi:hypothetical protein